MEGGKLGHVEVGGKDQQKKKKRTSSKKTMINGGLTHGDIVLFCHLQREGKVGPFCILHGVHDVLETQFFLNLAEVKAVHFTCRFHHPRVEINIVAHQNQRVGMTSLFGVLDRLDPFQDRVFERWSVSEGRSDLLRRQNACQFLHLFRKFSSWFGIRGKLRTC